MIFCHRRRELHLNHSVAANQLLHSLLPKQLRADPALVVKLNDYQAGGLVWSKRRSAQRSSLSSSAPSKAVKFCCRSERSAVSSRFATLRPWVFGAMVISPNATMVTRWSLILSGIFTGGILKVSFFGSAKTGAAKAARSKTSSSIDRPQKSEIQQRPAEMCITMVHPFR
jgi:hypothetical protein